jgi:flavin-dependent dehydrogenase
VRPHALVIGGGPAGSLAAMLLARGGWRVTLVEQHRFPRDKVCGECVSSLGIDVLARHGVLCDGVPLRRTSFHGRNGESAMVDLPRPMLGVSRAVLDSYLLDAAEAAGVVVLQPARCESLTTVRSLVDNALTELTADITILADGKAALTADRPPPTGEFGMQAHFAGVDGPTDAIELFAVDGHYGGLAPIQGALHNWSFAVPAHRLQGDLDALFGQIVSENLTLADRMRRARRVGEWNTSPLPRFGVQSHWPAKVIPVGNAAAAIEPIGGEGIGLALRSAELAVQALLSGSYDPATLRARYRELWTPRRLACRMAGIAMSSPMSGWVVQYLDENPLTDRMLAWMGKTVG